MIEVLLNLYLRIQVFVHKSIFFFMPLVARMIVLLCSLIIGQTSKAYDVEVDGIYYNLNQTDKTAEVTYNKYGDYSGNITIPSQIKINGYIYSISSIGRNAFGECKGLTSIIIPATIERIEDYAFSSCHSLKSFTLPKNVISIGKGIFGFCSSLSVIKVESGNAFFDSRNNCNAIIEKSSNKLIIGCKGTIIPDGIYSIGDYAFDSCDGLTTINIPSSVVSIGFMSFNACTKLSSVSISNGVVSIGMMAFADCTSLKSIEIPKSITSFDYGPFIGCSGLESIIVNKDNPVFDSRNNCNAIIDTSTDILVLGCKNTVFPSKIKGIGKNAFHGCADLSSLIIPDGVTSIGERAYQGCTRLLSVTLPQTISSLDRCAFAQCSNLSTVTSKIDNPFYISDDVFSEVSSNAKLYVPKGTKSKYRSFSGWTANFKDIVESAGTQYSLSIQASGNGSVTYNGISIRNRTTSFTVNEGTSATITFTPDTGYRIVSVKAGNTDVTSSVRNNQYTISSISANTTVSVTFEAIPVTTYSLSITASGNGSVTYSGTSVRNRTTSFTVNEGTTATITITPDTGYRIASVKVGNTDVTSSVKNNQLTISSISANTTISVTFEAIPVTTYSLSITASGNGSVTYNGTAVKNKTTTFTVDEGTSATLTFTPDNGYQLASVKVGNTDVTSSVSNNKYTISSITADKTVTVTFEATQTGTYDVEVDGIYYNLFNNKTAEVTNTNVNGGDYSGSISIPSSINANSIQYSVTSISNEAFENCWELTSITIPNSITSIGNAAFRCSGLTSITIPNSVTSIGAMAFFSCSNLTSITLPNSVTNIDNHTFNHCEALTSINIPNSVISIGNWAFSDCSSLKSINIPNSIVSIGEGAFNNCSGLTSITIPNNVTSIGEHAFWQCSSLSEVISNIEIPFKISSGVFEDISNNAILYVPHGTKSSYQAFSGWTLHFKDIVEGGVTQYSLSVISSGNGSVTFDGSTIRNSTYSFTVDEGASAILTFTPDNGYRLASVKVGSTSVLSNVKNNQYTINNITANVSVAVEFAESPKEVVFEGVNYTVASNQEKTVTVAKGNYGQVLTVPATFSSEGATWTVTGVDVNALSENKDIAAIIWEPKVPFTETVSNPNLLLYVTSAEYAPSSIKNVVVNGTAASITLIDAAEGNDFYCPKEFTARLISYSHQYGMTTGIQESRGWETIALPFDVEQITHSSKGTLVPFMNWNSSGVTKPFWLYEYGAGGFRQATAIRANTPYIISMPNNDQYLAEYRVNGTVTFSAENVKVQKTEDIQVAINGDYTFVPNFMKQDASSICYALNVNNSIVTNNSSTAGSMFVRNSRAVHPFEAYMTTQTSNAKPYISVFEDVPTGIRDVELLKDQIQSKEAWYTLEGQKMSGTPEKKGVYIHNGKKTIVR